MDPSIDKAMIYSGNFWKEYDNETGLPKNYNYRTDKYKFSGNAKGEGLLIDLTTPEIFFGTGNFYVTKDGYIHASAGGDIGGWVVDNHSLYSNISLTKGRITLDAGTYDEETNTVTGPGKIYSHNHNSLNTAGKGFYLSNDGLSIGTKFKIDVSDNPDGTNKGGILRLGLGAVDPNSSSDHWIIDGKESNDVQKYNSKGEVEKDQNGNPLKISKSRSFISYGNNANDTYFIPAGQQHNSKVYIGTDGISLGNNFSVDNQGNLISRTGYIGGWEITSNTLTAGNITLNSNGSITGGSSYAWSIDTNGSAVFNNLTANGSGTIGGWKIGNSTLTGGSLILNSNGSMSGPYWSIGTDGVANFRNSFSVSNITINAKGSFGSGGSLSGGGMGMGSGGSFVNPNSVTDGSGTTLQKRFDSLYAKKAEVEDLDVMSKLKYRNIKADWHQVLTGVRTFYASVSNNKLNLTLTFNCGQFIGVTTQNTDPNTASTDLPVPKGKDS